MDYQGVYSTDWLASNTVFYNEKSLKVSGNINEVVDYNNFEWNPEGLYLYLKFGYTVLGITPFKNVKFLLPNSTLRIENGKINITKSEDDVLNLLHIKSDEYSTLNLLQDRILKWENSHSNDILIPTSGGFDSRILNVMIEDKSRIQTYTYGISKNQDHSKEVVHAKLLSEKLGTKWERIPIGHYHQFFKDWDNLYGPSVNYTGLYHFEFYDQIRKIHPNKQFSVLSGIIGDAWAGAVNINPVNSIKELLVLGHTHGIKADERYLKLKHDNQYQIQYFEENKTNLKDPLFRIVETMRFKLLFLSFLNKIPRYLGYTSWSPFLEKDVALAMINIDPERRKNRQWQRDYFSKHGLLFEEMNLKWSRVNSVNYQALKNAPLLPLNAKLLSEIIDENYIRWINNTVTSLSFSQHVYQILMHTPYVKGGLQLVGFKNKLIEAYCAYMTIKPLETAIIKRNK